MLKGALVAFVILVAGLPVPVLHFFWAPVAPFVAGFFGGAVAKADEGRILLFGLVVAGLMAIPALVILLLRFLGGLEQIYSLSSTLVVVVAIAIVPYTWFGVTVGALVSYASRSGERGEE